MTPPYQNNMRDYDKIVKKDGLGQSDPRDADLDFLLWNLLNQSRDALLRSLENELAYYHLSPMETHALFHICNIGEGATPAELSRRMFREHNTVSELLDRMIKKGLIIRYRDSDRKNIWRIAITEKGRKANQQGLKIEAIHQGLADLSQEEKQQLITNLRKIRDNVLQQLIIPPVLPFPQ